MMQLSFTMNPIVLVLLCSAFVLAVVVVVWSMRRSRTVKRAVNYCNADDSEGELAPASVVVYAHNDGGYLERFLPYLLNQDYPQYEVIVVNDASIDNTAEVISDFLMQYKNLRQTFIPEGSRNVSRRKLAVMLGIKAANYEQIVLTNANCCPAGPNWLKSMCRNFRDGIDVVIGYSHPRYKKDNKFGKNFRVYDNVTDSVQYLSSDINGYPMRGTNDNLAYRRSTFFANNGFQRTLMLHYGDDDIFVSEIAHEGNTAIELSDDSMMTAHYRNYKKMHAELRMHHDFTAKKLRRWPFISSSIVSACNYAGLGCLAAAVALDYMNIVTIAAAALILIVQWTLMIVTFRRNAVSLKAPKLHIGVPFYALIRPVVNFKNAIRGYFLRESNYTWHRLK